MDPNMIHYLEGSESSSDISNVSERDEMPSDYIPSFGDEEDRSIGTVDTAILLVSERKIAEGAQKLLAPFAVALPEHGEVVAIVEEAGTQASRTVRAMLRGRESGSENLSGCSIRMPRRMR